MGGYFSEWRLKGRKKAKNFLIKFIFVTVLVLFFLVLYFPLGINGYLSQNWRVTLFLKNGVDVEKGRIFSERLGRLDFVRSARYYSEEEVWNEFISSVGNPENLKDVIGSPIPGYIEVKLNKEHINEKSLKRLIVISGNENITKDILYGGSSFYRMVRIKRYLNASFILAYIFFFLMTAMFLYYLDSDLIFANSREMLFMREHGRDITSNMPTRIAGSVWEGLVTGCISFGISVACLNTIILKFPSLKAYLSFPSITDYYSFLIPFIAVLIMTSILYFIISYFSFKKIKTTGG